MKKTNVHRLLDKRKIDYQIHEYPWTEERLDAKTAASQAHIDLEKVYKTLVAVGDKTGTLVACIRAEDELDLKALAKHSGNKKSGNAINEKSGKNNWLPSRRLFTYWNEEKLSDIYR